MSQKAVQKELGGTSFLVIQEGELQFPVLEKLFGQGAFYIQKGRKHGIRTGLKDLDYRAQKSGYRFYLRRNCICGSEKQDGEYPP